MISQVSRVDAVYGQKRNMLVMDNNILCSPKLPSIVEDIYALGFTGEANYTYPNKFIFTMAKIQRRQKYGLDISRQLSQTIEELDKFSNRLKNFQKISGGKISGKTYHPPPLREPFDPKTTPSPAIPKPPFFSDPMLQ